MPCLCREQLSRTLSREPDRLSCACPDYPVHPEVIADALSEAARHWDGSRRGGSEAAEDLQQAVAWIEEMPVLHDRIVLLQKKLDSLAPEHPKLEHPLRPVLAGHIRRWMDGFPAADRADYPEGGLCPSTRPVPMRPQDNLSPKDLY